MRIGGSVMKPYNSPAEWLAHVKELNYSAVIFPNVPVFVEHLDSHEAYLAASAHMHALLKTIE